MQVIQVEVTGCHVHFPWRGALCRARGLASAQAECQYFSGIQAFFPVSRSTPGGWEAFPPFGTGEDALIVGEQKVSQKVTG